MPWLEASVASGLKAIKVKLGAGDAQSDVAVVADVRRMMNDDNGSRCFLLPDRSAPKPRPDGEPPHQKLGERATLAEIVENDWLMRGWITRKTLEHL